MALFAPAGSLEVVFSFDTTGSMYSCLEQVRGRVQDLIQRLQGDIPGIRMAVFAHGDYCDQGSSYVTKWLDFTTDVGKLCHFVQTVGRTGGGDSPECYELVMHQVTTELSWTPGSRRALVLIGDDLPHEADYAQNTLNIDWKAETKNLAFMGVTIYGVQCGSHGTGADNFYKTISMATGGKHLKLDAIGNLFDVMMAVCYREGNDTAMLASYEKEVRARCGTAAIGPDIDAIFASLRSDDTNGRMTPVLTTPAKPKKAKATTKVSKVVRPSPFAKTTSLKATISRKSLKVFRPKHVRSLRDFQHENLPLLRRENVPETNFGLNALQWTPWMLVMCPDKPNCQEEKWVKRRGLTGYRLHMVKSTGRMTNVQRQVLFEVSVWTPINRSRRHVVYSSLSTRCLNNARWEHCLRVVRGQLDRVLQNGCQVFLRYTSVRKRSDPSQLRAALKRYDYAWKKIRQVREHAREVSKGKYSISMADSV